MEQGFYGLQQRTNIVHYIVYISVILPMMFTTACTVQAKLLTTCCSVRYCETMLYVLTMKVNNLHRLPKEAAREEVRDIIYVHQRTLDCIALLVTALRPAEMDVKFVNIAILFFVLTIETFGQCYVGTRVSNQADELTKAVYACGWQDADHEIQQNLLMILHRTQLPISIQAGKFCFVNMECFQKMVNTSYSFYIVLKDAF
ncbi:odorant receptor 33a-like [Anopheles marshallii]|uniref:odorant receptor 33a-like n=1 Tax=Anopheles marshallii TaxID=1521116 RepID=UPI00237AB286|nr:odorant receptor 33a-like [Anopheles marshallii]